MKMKKFKKFVSLLAAASLCALLPSINTITAHAAEPVTYYVKYNVDDSEWDFQTGGWSETEYNRDPYYMLQEINDGDIVVIDSSDTDAVANFSFSKRLSNLTVTIGSSAVISAPGIDEVYVLSDSSCAVSGNVTNAHVFDEASFTANNDVNFLELIDTQAMSTGKVSVKGTVAHALRRTESGYNYFEIFNVAKDKFFVDYGVLETNAAYYSTTPSATQAAPTPAATTPTPTTQNTSNAASGEYDDVPKTGENNLIFWLLGISVLCLAGRRVLKEF